MRLVIHFFPGLLNTEKWPAVIVAAIATGRVTYFSVDISLYILRGKGTLKDDCDPTWPIGRSLVGGVSVGDEDDDDECDGSRVCEDSEGCIDGVGGGGKEKVVNEPEHIGRCHAGERRS